MSKLYAAYMHETESRTSSADSFDMVDWGTLNDLEKFVQACELKNLAVLVHLIDSNDTNEIEGGLGFF